MISVVIRTRNEVGNLVVCLKKLAEQNEEHEVIVVDSYSDDDTERICQEQGCRVVQCKRFTYGRALNQGIEAAEGDKICILSGHCFPKDKNFLRYLKKPFSFQDNIVGVYAKQSPHRNTNLLEYRNFLYIYRNEKIIQDNCPFFNNAASMIKKDIWKEIKFDEEVKAQEDMIWAREILRRGYRIVYEPRAEVVHLHEDSIENTVRRYIKEAEVMKEMGFR